MDLWLLENLDMIIRLAQIQIFYAYLNAIKMCAMHSIYHQSM